MADIGVRPSLRTFEITKYYIDGNSSPAEDAFKQPLLVAGQIGLDDSAVFTFSSDRQMLEFASRLSVGRRIAEDYGMSKMLSQAPERENDEGLKARLSARVKTWQEELKSYGASLGARDPGESASKGLFDPSPVEGPILGGSAILFATYPMGGGFVPVGRGSLPNLKWFGADNTMSSALVYDHVYLCDLPWFKGKSVHIYGYGLFHLASVGMDNRVSSASA